jgi:hypothetical protein
MLPVTADGKKSDDGAVVTTNNPARVPIDAGGGAFDTHAAQWGGKSKQKESFDDGQPAGYGQISRAEIFDTEAVALGAAAAATAAAAPSSDDAASLRTYATAKTFVTVAPAWILGEPTLTPGAALQIRRLEAGDSFTASAEMVVVDDACLCRMGTAAAGAAGAAGTAPTRVMLRVCLGAEEAATHGWVVEEDDTGSVVCVDLSYCLKPPISKVSAPR